MGDGAQQISDRDYLVKKACGRTNFDPIYETIPGALDDGKEVMVFGAVRSSSAVEAHSTWTAWYRLLQYL